MGFFDSLSDIVAAATPWTTVEAEAPKGGAGEEKNSKDKEEGEGEGESGKKVCDVLLLWGIGGWE